MRIASLLLLVTFLSADIAAQALHRTNPEGWFTLIVPKWATKLEKHADVDGGFYYSPTFNITWDYWLYENTPNFLRDTNGEFSRSATLVCPNRSKRRLVLSGFQAVEQVCVRVIPGIGRRHVYYVGFDHVPVRAVDTFGKGIFNLRVEFKNKRDAKVAERIVRSIRFTQNK